MNDETTRNEFIEFLLGQSVLQFGEFTLNSGRLSPYFFNLGKVCAGSAYATLGRAYAKAIMDAGLECDVLFGPAYKGIPIAVATAMALGENGVDVAVAYNRKEAKDHGEGGMLVGAPVTGKVVLIDDVLTSGKAIRDAVSLIAQTKAEITGAVIALDRQEVLVENPGDQTGEKPTTAVQGLAQEIAAPVISIANMAQLVRYLDEVTENATQEGSPDAATLGKMRDYQARYCLV